MMLYSKGDTFKTEDGLIGLVLGSRMSGVEFCRKYGGMEVSYIALTEVHIVRVADDWKYTVDSQHSHTMEIETFYYPVLIGDKKGWMELEDHETHKHEKIEG